MMNPKIKDQEGGERKRRRLWDNKPKLIPRKRIRDHAEGEGEKIFLFCSHSNTRLTHTLYSLDLPVGDGSPMPNTTVKTTITTTTTTGSTSSTTHTAGVDRRSLHPVLEFDCRWPRDMSCLALGKTLYFMGGQLGSSHPNKVFLLDITALSSSSDELVLKSGPRMKTGKIGQRAFVADDKIFVLSAKQICPHTGAKLAQFECFTGQSWEVLEDPPFTDVSRLSAHVVVGRTVIVSASKLTGGYREHLLYSYDLDDDEWLEFDTREWNTVNDLGFFLTEGSEYIDGAIVSTYNIVRGAIPSVIKLKKYDSEDPEELVLREDRMYDAIKYKLMSRHIASTLVAVGDGRMGFVQIGTPPADTDDPDDFNPEETHMSISVFDARGEKATYLSSAHFVTYPGQSHTIRNAFTVIG